MAKMNKAQAVEHAKQAARSSDAVKSMTYAKVESLSYDERRHMASELSVAYADTIETPYTAAAMEAFVDEAMRTWGAVLKQRESARRAFATTCSGISVEEAQQKVVDLLKSMNMRGARINTGYAVTCEVERTFGAGATLYVKFERDYDAPGVQNPDDEMQRAGSYHVVVDVNWSGTSRSLSEAELALKVYRELLDAAHEVQVVMDRERVCWTFGVPDAAPATTTQAEAEEAN